MELKIQRNAFLSLHTWLIFWRVITSFLFFCLFASCYIKKLPFFCSLNQQQTENKAQETEHELDLAKQQSALEDGLSRLRVKLQRNQEQAIHVGAQAESAQRQAGGLQEVISPTPATKSTRCFSEGGSFIPRFWGHSSAFPVVLGHAQWYRFVGIPMSVKVVEGCLWRSRSSLAKPHWMVYSPPARPRVLNDLLVTFVLNFQTLTVYATILYAFAFYSK